MSVVSLDSGDARAQQCKFRVDLQKLGPQRPHDYRRSISKHLRRLTGSALARPNLTDAKASRYASQSNQQFKDHNV